MTRTLAWLQGNTALTLAADKCNNTIYKEYRSQLDEETDRVEQSADGQKSPADVAAEPGANLLGERDGEGHKELQQDPNDTEVGDEAEEEVVEEDEEEEEEEEEDTQKEDGEGTELEEVTGSLDEQSEEELDESQAERHNHMVRPYNAKCNWLTRGTPLYTWHISAMLCTMTLPSSCDMGSVKHHGWHLISTRY